MRRKVELWLREHFGSFPLELLHALHYDGIVHYQDFFKDLDIAETIEDTIKQRLKTLGIFSFVSIATFCLSYSHERRYAACQTLLHWVIYNITSDQNSSDSLLEPLLELLSQSQQSRTYISLLLHCLSNPTECTTKNWENRTFGRQDVVDGLCSLFPSSLLLDELILLSSETRTCPSLLFALAAKLDQDILWEALDRSLKQNASTALIPVLSSQLTFAFHLNKARYYELVLDLKFEDAFDSKTWTQILLAVLEQLPSFIATEHVNKLRASHASSKPWVKVFAASVTLLLQRRDAAPSPALPIASSSSSSASKCENHVSKWIDLYKSTHKPPLKEMGMLKMFQPTELSAALDLLLANTLILEEKAPSVDLVFELGRLKWFGARKFEDWEEARFSRQRAKLSSKSGSSRVDSVQRNPKISDLKELLDRWAKNVACGETNVIGASVASLLKCDEKNASSVHELLWTTVMEVANVTGSKKKSRALEIDKFVSCTFVAQSGYLYPLLAEAILAHLDSSTPSYGAISTLLTVIASHDRLCEYDFLSRLWHPTHGCLAITSKNGLSSKLTLASNLLKAILERFKAVAMRNKKPTSTALTLESAQTRIGILDQTLVFSIVWLAKKVELACLTNASRKHRFALLNKELMEVMANPILKPIMSNHNLATMDQLIELEVAFEAVEFEDLSSLKHFLPIVQTNSTTDESKVQDIVKLSFWSETIDAKRSPAVKRFVKASLALASKSFYNNQSSVIEDPRPRRSLLSGLPADGDAENVDPNTTRKSIKTALFRPASRGSIATHLATSSPTLSTPPSQTRAEETSHVFVPGSSWLLDALGRQLSRGHEDFCRQIENWMEDAKNVDERWWWVEDKFPRAIAVSSAHRLILACDKLVQSSCTSSAIILMNLSLKGLEEMRNLPFAENQRSYEEVVSLLHANSLFHSLLTHHLQEFDPTDLVSELLSTNYGKRSSAPMEI